MARLPRQLSFTRASGKVVLAAKASEEILVSTRRLPPCRRERAFDLRGVCMSAVKIKGSQQYGDHHRS